MPDLNTIPAAGISRQPRGAVKLNGTIVAGCESWEVDNNAFRAADTFRATFALGGLPAAFGAGWFATQASIRCEIFATEAPADPDNYRPTDADRQILGQVDDIAFDMVAGTVEISGRDLTALFIDTKGTVGYLNKTSSQIATILAGQAGLTPVVTATKTTVGTLYSQNHASLTQERSQWDILCQLAQFEDFDVFVRGSSLYFQPKPTDTGTRYAIQWTPPSSANAVPSANATDLQFSRSLTIAKGVVVTVRSWNAKQKKGFTVSWPKTVHAAAPGTSGASGPISYNYSKPGLDVNGATQFARRKYAEVTRHMMKMAGDLPGDSILNCRLILQVRGTGTAFDQDYSPDSVKRSMSQHEGYRMALTAKNISQDQAGTE